MVQAAELSKKMGWLTSDDVDRIKRILLLANLPITPPPIAVDTALSLMGHDKKVKHGQIRLILLKSLGEAVLTNDFDPELLTDVLLQHATHANR